VVGLRHAGDKLVDEDLHLAVCFLDAGDEVVVTKQRRDGDAETGDGGDQGGGDSGRDGVDVDVAGRGDGGKRIMTPTTVPSRPRNGPPEMAIVSITIMRLRRWVSRTKPLSSAARIAWIDCAERVRGRPLPVAKRRRISCMPRWNRR
jgi:hypothetical protein